MSHIRDTTSGNVPVLIHRGDEMLCTTCNWHPHDLSVHGELCRNGHPIAIVGRYGNGVCRACQRFYSRRWWARTHASSGATPRDNGANTGGRSVAGPGAAAVTVAPTTLKAATEFDHPDLGTFALRQEAERE